MGRASLNANDAPRSGSSSLSSLSHSTTWYFIPPTPIFLLHLQSPDYINTNRKAHPFSRHIRDQRKYQYFTNLNNSFIMVLKRKRSASELCSSPSASSTCSSTFSFSSPKNAFSAPIFWDNSNVSRNLFNAPAHLNSRTMKRFRDGRPSEELVHRESPFELSQHDQRTDLLTRYWIHRTNIKPPLFCATTSTPRTGTPRHAVTRHPSTVLQHQHSPKLSPPLLGHFIRA